MIREELRKFERELYKEYLEQDLCLYDFLAEATPPSVLSYEDCLQVYVDLMHEVEGDEFFRYVENERENLFTGVRD